MHSKHMLKLMGKKTFKILLSNFYQYVDLYFKAPVRLKEADFLRLR